jgi:hypothetical protein
MITNDTTVAQISSINTGLTTSVATTKTDTTIANPTRKATQDAGRVHFGAGMMRF